MLYFLDTSAVLNGALNNYDNIYVSPVVVAELEHIKTSAHQDDNKKLRARAAVRDIINNKNIEWSFVSQKKIMHLLKKYNFLSDTNDHRLICEALLLQKEREEQIAFVTYDGTQYLFLQQFPQLLSIYYPTNPTDSQNEAEYCGWGKYFPTAEQFEQLYTLPQFNILKAKTNEFCELYEGDKLKDVRVWNGHEYRQLKYKEFIATTGERIAPRNLEQKMYLDLLQNDTIPIKLCIGRFGTGKSMFAETWATHELMAGKYNKIIFVKNNLEVKGAGHLGILPGDELSKQYPWLRQIEDHLGSQLFEEYLNDGRLEPAHLSTLRGRDLRSSLILVDEAENLLTTNIQLLLGRVGEGSQIIFCADIKQCDYKDEKMSGIPKLISSLAGEPLFGMVKLIKSERSLVAAAADLLD